MITYKREFPSISLCNTSWPQSRQMVGIYFPFIFTLFYEETAQKLGFLAQKRIRGSDRVWYHEVNEYFKRGNRTNVLGNGLNNLLYCFGPFVLPFSQQYLQIQIQRKFDFFLSKTDRVIMLSSKTEYQLFIRYCKLKLHICNSFNLPISLWYSLEGQNLPFLALKWYRLTVRV